MVRHSAGLLMYRQGEAGTEVFLVHLGGPFWVKKDWGAWSIPKGEYGDDETAFAAAKREFQEETGFVPHGEFIELPEIKQAGGKWVKAWMFEGDADPNALRSNTFTMEYPPGSGEVRTYPEVDRAAWFSLPEARERILKSQIPLLDALAELLSRTSDRQRGG